MSPKPRRWWIKARSRARTLYGAQGFGVAVTAAWLVAVIVYFSWADGRWSKLWNGEPNIFGDFLAGAFAPLAFLWLVIAVFLQKNELELQRQELKQTTRALQLQAGETRALVEQNKLSVGVAQAGLEAQRRKEDESRLLGIIEVLATNVRRVGPEAIARRPQASDHWLLGDPTHLSETHRVYGAEAVFNVAVERLGTFNKIVGTPGFVWLIKNSSELAAEMSELQATAEAIIAEGDTDQQPLVRAHISMLRLHEFVDNLKQVVAWLSAYQKPGRR